MNEEQEQANPAPLSANAKPARGWTIVYAIGALLLIGAALAWLLTRESNAPQVIAPSGQQSEAASNVNDPEMQSVLARLNDAQQVNRVLREQSLALSQRLDLVEQTLAALRREAAPSAESFKLDEAQYLLSLAETRLDLFSDPESAARALELADNLLAGMGDPGLASVRQTLSIELDVVRAAPVNDLPALSGRLRALTLDLDQVPVRIDPVNTNESRLWSALDRYLVVRREGEPMPALGRSAWAVREGLTIEFERAQLALERQQPKIWEHALATALQMAEQGFVAQDATAESFLTRLRSLAATELAPQPPKIGAALRELRRLRETRQGLPRRPLPSNPESVVSNEDSESSAASAGIENMSEPAANGAAPEALPAEAPQDTPSNPTPPAQAPSNPETDAPAPQELPEQHGLTQYELPGQQQDPVAQASSLLAPSAS